MQYTIKFYIIMNYFNNILQNAILIYWRLFDITYFKMVFKLVVWNLILYLM